jgi:NAD(P)H-dependent flavin oxidoreductase YrpB (nitropropane dioxygenase family)
VNLRPLIIGDIVAPVPVVQAGMGVQVAKSALAAAAGRAGAIGCISSVGIGSLSGSLDNYLNESNKKLAEEIRLARQLAPQGVLAVNIMVALSNYDEIVKVCVDEKVDIIISGAGLPLSLPGCTTGSPVKLIPVISSGRAMDVVLKTWHRRYQRLPDAVIVEGPLCGGHLGFTYAQLAAPATVGIAMLLADVRAVLAPYEAEYGKRIPVLGAENISTVADVHAMLALGFDGVQIGTRFFCTEEAGIHVDVKRFYAKATSNDIVVIGSPVGMPVRVLRNRLIERLLAGEKIPFGCPFRCLRACDARAAKFCIAEALTKTLFGDIDNALLMTGCGIGAVNNILPAEEFLAPLTKLVR